MVEYITIGIRCDGEGCRKSQSLRSTATGSQSNKTSESISWDIMDAVAKRLKAFGWTTMTGADAYCPECSKDKFITLHGPRPVGENITPIVIKAEE